MVKKQTDEVAGPYARAELPGSDAARCARPTFVARQFLRRDGCCVGRHWQKLVVAILLVLAGQRSHLDRASSEEP